MPRDLQAPSKPLRQSIRLFSADAASQDAVPPARGRRGSGDREATEQGIDVVPVSESHPFIFIGEAPEAFAERFE